MVILLQAQSPPIIPSIVYNGTNYLVVGENHHWYWYYSYSRIWGALIRPSGTVDTCVIISQGEYGSKHNPTVSTNGTDYFVVWQDLRNLSNLDIYGARVTMSGNVLDPSGIPITVTSPHQQNPSVSFDGSNYLIIWNDSYNIYGKRVSQSGLVVDSTEIVITEAPNSQSVPSIVFGNQKYFAVWQDLRSGNQFDIYGTRITPSGNVLDSTGIAVTTTENDQKLPRIAFNSMNFFVAWEDFQTSTSWDIFGARIDTSGEVLDTIGLVMSNDADNQGNPALAFNGSNWLVSWDDKRISNRDIVCKRVSVDATIIDSVGISVATMANLQSGSSVVFQDTNFFVVWQDYRAGCSYDIYGARVDSNGHNFDPDGIAISTASGEQELPAIIYGRDNFFVVWQDSRNNFIGDSSDIYGTRLSSSGNVLDPEGIRITNVIGTVKKNPAISLDSNNNYFIVWQDNRNGNNYNIYGARVNTEGQVLDPIGIQISTSQNDEVYPAIAFGDSNYFVIWIDLYGGGLYGTRVSTTGQIVDTSAIYIDGAPIIRCYPAISFDGTNYLIVYSLYLWDWEYYYATLIDQCGNILNKTLLLEILRPSDNTRHFAVDFNGTNYIVVWDFGAFGMIDGAKIDQLGGLIESFIVCSDIANQSCPRLDHTPSGKSLITFNGWADTINGRPANTMRIWGKFYPFTGIQENDRKLIPNTGFKLQVFPNPFLRITNIDFSFVKKSDNLKLIIYDISSRLVKSFNHLANHQFNQVAWSGDDEHGQQVPDGIYFIELMNGKEKYVKKVIKIGGAK